MSLKKYILLLLTGSLCWTACVEQRTSPVKHTDTLTSGKIKISVDESFRPVMEEQLKVFLASNPDAQIEASYKTEAECLKDVLLGTETRMAIVTRGLSAKEEKFFKDSLGYSPSWNELATDALVVVLHPSNPDTLFTKEKLRNLLSGRSGSDVQVVFDGKQATSAVRYALDSLLQGQPFDTSVVRAVGNSQGVLNFVAENPKAIGLVGISWIGNPQDPEQVAMLKRVKMGWVACDYCEDKAYVKPTQIGIVAKRYPLVRGLYFILKENPPGLGAGFVNFMQYERGQLIFRRSYLGSSRMGFAIRSVKINEKIPESR